jgi:hypothetical protein
MADYTDTKPGPSITPENAIEADYGRLEPIIGPTELRQRHLFGIPLVSQLKDPYTGRPQIMTDDFLRDYIDGAMQQGEQLVGIDFRPVIHKEKYPFDRNSYESYGYFMLNHRPVSNLAHIAVAPANGTEVYSVPLEWVEVANMVRGQINIIPMTAAFIQGGTVPAGQTGSSYFLAILGNKFWVPAYWQITYTSGFPDGLVPRVVNDLIGTIAAMEILSMLAVTFARTNSHSLGLDGLSQSISTPGPQIFAVRLEELEKKKTELVKKLKAKTGRKIFSTWT